MSRDGRTFRALRSERHRRPGKAFVEHIKLALHPAVSRILGIEGWAAGQQDIAIRQVERPRVAGMRIVMSKRPHRPAVQIDLINIAEGAREEDEMLAVRRKVGAPRSWPACEYAAGASNRAKGRT